MNLKGSLPLLILHVLHTGPRHGYDIAREIKQRSQGTLDFREGTLYPALHTLEKQGCITAYSELENGRTRRYYQLTDRGIGELAQERDEWRRYSQAVNRVLTGGSS